MSFTGVLRSKPYFSSIDSICQNIIWFLYFPNGTMAPWRMDSPLSGMTFVMSISLMYPRPLHFGHAPSGELNENLFGAGSPYDMPVVGHISLLL